MLLLDLMAQGPLSSSESSCQSLGGQSGELKMFQGSVRASRATPAHLTWSHWASHTPRPTGCALRGCQRGSARAWHWEPPGTERSYNQQGVWGQESDSSSDFIEGRRKEGAGLLGLGIN